MHGNAGKVVEVCRTIVAREYLQEVFAGGSLSSLGQAPSASLALKFVDDLVHLPLRNPLLLLLLFQRLCRPTSNFSQH